MHWHGWEIKPEPTMGQDQESAGKVEWKSSVVSAAHKGNGGIFWGSKTTHWKVLFKSVFWGQRKWGQVVSGKVALNGLHS